MSQNIPEETMKKVELLWTKVGFVVQLSQMVEYNLANILGFDEILKRFDDEKIYITNFDEWRSSVGGI